MVAYDYSRLADWYDLFCVYDGDVEFFRRHAALAAGSVLELMAGTGRLSLPLLASGVDLTCLDQSPAMLAVLRGKIHVTRRVTVCGDAASLPFSQRFDSVLLPFQGLSELLAPADHLRLIAEAFRVLRPGGRFVCTFHNPSVRARSIDGEWHDVGAFPTPDGGQVELALWTELDSEARVRGRQRVRRIDRDRHTVEEREVALEFSLPRPDAVLDMAESVGFDTIEMLGDYQGRPWEEQTSPCCIAVFEKPRTGRRS